MPPGTIAAIPLLEDWRIPSRLACATERPGCFEGDALALARRTIVLEDARLAESGELVSLLAAPQSRLLRQCAAQIEKLRARN
mgnify:CR=1 FL=1